MDPGLSFHDFRLVYFENTKKVFFDLVVPCHLINEAPDIINHIKTEVESLGGEYQVNIQVDQEFAMLHSVNGAKE